jgi:DNA polymerase III alpha subunit
VKIDNYGRVTITEDEAFDALYSGKLEDFDGVLIEGNIDQYNQSREQNADRIPQLKIPKSLEFADLKTFDQTNQLDWFMPEEYKNMDIEGFLVEQCPKQNYERLVEELELFRQHNMMYLLKYIKYLVDTMRKHNIVWGVGRGSSVASYCLYLIGIHKIDSIKYNLDIDEFLKKGEQDGT